MRFFILCLMAMLLVLYGAAQKNKQDNFKFSNFTERQLILAKPDIKSVIKEANVQVADWRADTTAIGFENQFYFTIPAICEEIKNNLKQVINLGNDSGTSQVVVCLKKIWITKHLTKENDDWKGGIIWKIACVKKVNDKFIYLCRLDTMIERWPGKFIEDASNLISICMLASAKKINSALSIADNAAKFVDLNQYRYTFNSIPVLSDSIKKKGVYITYKQFLENAPADVPFEMEKGKLTDALRVMDADGTYQLKRDVWGLCDGQNMYIKSGEKYYQLYRVNNTFYIIGSKNIEKHLFSDPGTASLLNLATNSNRKITVYTVSNSPYQLDITNGEIY